MGVLDGMVAVITGAASGIGEASARAFVAEGARVVIADVQDEAGQALAAELKGAAVHQHADVSSEDDVRAVIARAVGELGGLDIMFNNAGALGTVGPIAEIPLVEYERTMAVLLRGVFLGIKHAAAVMAPSGRGSIINTASIAGIQPGWGPHIYAAAKAGVIQLTRSTAIELGERGVRVNCICPGGIATPLVAAIGGAQVPLDAVRKAMATTQPIRRAGEPQDIAATALWLASDAASYVTGAAIVVDGGMALGPLWARQPPAFTQRPT